MVVFIFILLALTFRRCGKCRNKLLLKVCQYKCKLRFQLLQRTRIPEFAIAFVAVAQLNIRITLMKKMNSPKYKPLIFRSHK